MDLEKAYNKIDNFCCSNHNTLQGNKVRYLNDREETIDMFSDYQETKDDDFCKDANEMVEALETIKGLVDLQKEIGCPLDVYVKATIDGIKVDGSTFKVKVRKDKDGYYFALSNGSAFPFYLKNYKKTWKLEEDKFEDNNYYRILDYALFKEIEFKYLETYKNYTILKASLNLHNSEYVIKELGFNTRWASLTYCKKYIKEKLGQEEK